MDTAKETSTSSPIRGDASKGPYLFIVVGAFMLAAGLYMAFVPKIPPERIAETSGNIVSINRALPTNSKRNRNTIVTVSYSVDGREYREELDFYHSGMNVGDRVTLHYDTAKPEIVAFPGGRSFGGGAVIFMGLIFMGVGTLLLKRRHCH